MEAKRVEAAKREAEETRANQAMIDQLEQRVRNRCDPSQRLAGMHRALPCLSALADT